MAKLPHRGRSCKIAPLLTRVKLLKWDILCSSLHESVSLVGYSAPSRESRTLPISTWGSGLGTCVLPVPGVSTLHSSPRATTVLTMSDPLLKPLSPALPLHGPSSLSVVLTASCTAPDTNKLEKRHTSAPWHRVAHPRHRVLAPSCVSVQRKKKLLFLLVLRCLVLTGKTDSLSMQAVLWDCHVLSTWDLGLHFELQAHPNHSLVLNK